MRTSYTYLGVELNDGLIYNIPTEGTNLDDRNNADESWAYRPGGDLPMPTGITLKEGVIVLNISIAATTWEQFEARLLALKKIFNTADPNYYKLYRKLPSETYYRYIEAASRQFSVNRIARSVTVTLHTPERAWKEDDWQEASWTLFADATRTYDLELTYDGITPVEPVVEVKALTVGSDGPVPLYYHDVDVYVSGAQHILNTPIRIITAWDTSGYVSGGQMRSDGLDITVDLPNGTRLRRWVGGAADYRHVWVNPQTWPSLPATVRLQGGSPIDGVDATATEIPIFAKTGTLVGMPSSGKVCIGDEIIAYTGLQITTEDGIYGKLTGCSRGQDSTIAASYVDADWWWVKWPVTLKVGYGYSTGYAGTYYDNDLSNWPVLDYADSSNKQWKQLNANTSPNYGGGYFGGRPLSWRSYTWLPERPGERVAGNYSATLESGTAKVQLYGQKLSNSGVSYRERLVCQLLPYSSRKVSAVQLKFTLWAGDSGAFTTTLAAAGVTRENFNNGYQVFGAGQYGTNERFVEYALWSQSSGNAAKDTGNISVDQEGLGATHVWLRVKEAPTNSVETTLLRLDEVIFTLDAAHQEHPVARFWPTQKGYGVDEFPVVMTWQNYNDTATPTFSIWPKLDEDETATFDCSTYEVTNALLAECSYSNPTWLRLVPGYNEIHVTGVQGVGQVQFKIKWKNKS